MNPLDIPDRVSLDLRRKQRQEHDAEIEHKLNKPARIFEARESIRSADELRKLLNDVELAGPLSELMDCQEALIYEIACIERDCRLEPGKMAAIKVAASAVAKIERQLLVYCMEE